MFAAIPAMWASATGWLSRNPVVLALIALGLALIGWEKIKSDIKTAAKKSERDAAARKSAEDHAAHVVTASTIKEEIRNDRDRAIEAGNNLPPVSHPDELRNTRPDIHSVLIRGD